MQAGAAPPSLSRKHRKTYLELASGIRLTHIARLTNFPGTPPSPRALPSHNATGPNGWSPPLQRGASFLRGSLGLCCRAGTCLSPVALAKGGGPPACGAPRVRALHTTAAPAVPPRRDRRNTPARPSSDRAKPMLLAESGGASFFLPVGPTFLSTNSALASARSESIARPRPRAGSRLLIGQASAIKRDRAKAYTCGPSSTGKNLHARPAAKTDAPALQRPCFPATPQAQTGGLRLSKGPPCPEAHMAKQLLSPSPKALLPPKPRGPNRCSPPLPRPCLPRSPKGERGSRAAGEGAGG